MSPNSKYCSTVWCASDLKPCLIGRKLWACEGTRIAFTNDAMLARLDRELAAERDRVDRQRAEDRKADAVRLERIETDIRAMRDLMFEALQRGRSD